MEKLKTIDLKISELEGLPLFLRKIYYNKVTFIEDEYKLYCFSPNVQSEKMRDYFSNRKICKINIFKP